jgi:alpha-1,2-mannosyltransferase
MLSSYHSYHSGWTRTAQFKSQSWFGIIVTCGICGVGGWVFYIYAFRGDPGQDWMVFYTAARAYIDGNLSLLSDGERLTEALNQRFAGWLSFPLNLHPWVYPPTFLLLFLPFGFLPECASLIVFLLAGFVAVLTAVWLYSRRDHFQRVHIFLLLLCPAVPFNVLTGQNAFYSSALLIGGFGLVDRSPAISGLVLGFLSFKPQLSIMVPVALLAGRRWRALLSTTITAAALALASWVVFGAGMWRSWFELTMGMSDGYAPWLAAGRLNGQSVFACATLLGASSTVANLAQGLTVAITAVCVYWVFCQRTRAELQLAALLAATILAGPHVSASDAVLLALAASLFLSGIAAIDPGSVRANVAVALWISPLFNPPALFRAGLLTPLLILVFLACVITLIREQAKPSS